MNRVALSPFQFPIWRLENEAQAIIRANEFDQRFVDGPADSAMIKFVALESSLNLPRTYRVLFSVFGRPATNRHDCNENESEHYFGELAGHLTESS